MADTGIKPFPRDHIDKALLREKWEKLLRSLELYLAAEEVMDVEKKRNKLLHFEGSQLQEVVYNLPEAIETFQPEQNTDIYKTLVDKLSEYFSPKQNSTFERHILRNVRPEGGENFNKYLLKVRQQATKYTCGNSAQEAL